jgi:hypothetical protein
VFKRIRTLTWRRQWRINNCNSVSALYLLRTQDGLRVCCVIELQELCCSQHLTGWYHAFITILSKICPELEVRVRFPALPDFPKSSGSVKDQPRTIEELLGWKSSGSGLENGDYGRRDPSLWQVGTNFADKRRLLGQYGSLMDLGHGVNARNLVLSFICSFISFITFITALSRILYRPVHYCLCCCCISQVSHLYGLPHIWYVHWSCVENLTESL